MPGPGAFLVGDEERQEVAEVMESGYLSRYGKADDPRFKRKVVTLEKRFAELIGTKYAVAVNGGTGAVMASHLGYLLKEPDRMIQIYNRMASYVTAHDIKPVIGKTFSFEAAMAAQSYIEQRHNIGKVLLKV